MATQSEQADLFRSLHIPGKPIILFNIWDAGSAAAVAGTGAKALATGSAPVAMAQGFADGEKMPLELALQNIERIIAAVDLPVTMDLEGGYGESTSAVADTIGQAMDRGIVGFNFEDQIVGTSELYSIEVQTARVAAARKAASSNGTHGFVNARTDIFLKARPDTHNDDMLSDAINRASAYEQAGADGFFAPGLADEKLIGRLCEEVNLPVNIIALPHVPPNSRLAELGVGRISYGPVPYRQMIKSLTQAATEALE
ncbi:phosphonomutase [Chromatiales bacterium (ex Bugula neritina AB1)]|nr:phosphonomutase [Chromatiales bacterium (ex Bugula neritina AB1)]